MAFKIIYPSDFKKINSSLALYENLDLKFAIPRGYLALGQLTFEIGELERAREWVEKCLERAKQLGLEKLVATCYYELGKISRDLKEFDIAIKHHETAIEIYRKFENSIDIAKQYHQIGIIEQKKENFEEAQAFFLRALKLFEKVTYPQIKVETLAQLGVNYHYLNNIKNCLLLHLNIK